MNMSEPATLRQMAKVVRSKNAGPFEITFDVMFDKIEAYERVKKSGAISRESLGKALGYGDNQITNFQFFDPALAFKLTVRRQGRQGSIGDSDNFGAQQHAPLLDLIIP
jgi:hypothetical protein